MLIATELPCTVKSPKINVSPPTSKLLLIFVVPVPSVLPISISAESKNKSMAFPFEVKDDVTSIELNLAVPAGFVLTVIVSVAESTAVIIPSAPLTVNVSVNRLTVSVPVVPAIPNVVATVTVLAAVILPC